MRDVIWLRCSRGKVEGMTKNEPVCRRGEIAVKVIVNVADTAYRSPVLEREVTVTDWREGLDFGDIELRESVITEEEAGILRARRREQVISVLRSQGYEITAPEPPEAEEE